MKVFLPSWISPPHEQLMCGFTSYYSFSDKTIQHVYRKWKKDTVLYNIKSPVTPVKKLHQDAWLGTLMPSVECWSHVLGHHLDSHHWSVNEKSHMKTFTLNLAVKWNKECQQSSGTDAVSLTNTSCMCLVQRFLGSHSFLSIWIMHLPSPLPLLFFHC